MTVWLQFLLRRRCVSIQYERTFSKIALGLSAATPQALPATEAIVTTPKPGWRKKHQACLPISLNHCNVKWTEHDFVRAGRNCMAPDKLFMSFSRIL